MAAQSEMRAEIVRLQAENVRLRSAAAEAGDERLGYPIDDQHDSLAVNLTEVQASIAANQIDKQGNLVIWGKLQDLRSKGAEPEANVRQWQLTIKLDALNELSLAEQEQTLQTKLRSLEGLQEKNALKFHQSDRDTNQHQLNWYEIELQKAKSVADHSAEEYDYLNSSYESGATPWGTWFNAKIDRTKTAAAVEGWKAKVAAQRKQLIASQADLDAIATPRTTVQ
jgi:hypothetical protein